MEDFEINKKKRELEDEYVYGRDSNDNFLQLLLQQANIKYPTATHRIDDNLIQQKGTKQWSTFCIHLCIKSRCKKCESLCIHFYEKGACEECIKYGTTYRKKHRPQPILSPQDIINQSTYGHDISIDVLQGILTAINTRLPTSINRIEGKVIQRKYDNQWTTLCFHMRVKNNCKDCQHLCIHFNQKDTCEYCIDLQKRLDRKKNYRPKETKVYHPDDVHAKRKERVKRRNAGLTTIENLKVESKAKIDNWILNGIVDRRNYQKPCPDCGKICIPFEKHDETFDPNIHTETRSTIRSDQSTFDWQSKCRNCMGIYNSIANNDPVNFFDSQLPTIKRHLIGTTEELKQLVKFIADRDNAICRSCGVKTILETKSGWRQFSLNDMHPDRRKVTKVAPIEDIACSCLACNLFQNDLSWDKFQIALREVASADLKLIGQTSDTKSFFDSLSKKERNYIIHGAADPDTCPIDIRIDMINMYQNICQLLGTKVVFEPNKWNSASYDRHNSKQPYTVIGNVQLTGTHANFVKQKKITNDQMMQWRTYIRNNPKFN